MTLREREDLLIDEICRLGDCFDQYSYLIFCAGTLPPMPAAQKTDAALVSGCQSAVWLSCSFPDGRGQIEADSDTLLLRGVLSILRTLISGASAWEVTETELDYLERTELASAFSSQRAVGIRQIFARVRAAAQEYCRSQN